MFEKFGEFDSVEELNRAAAGQKGDIDALIEMAIENGIDKEDAEDYADGIMDELATPLMAALGKIKVESEDLKLKAILQDWALELQSECAESEELARAVRKKDKKLAGYMAALAESGFENRTVVDKKIVELCKGEIKKIIGNHEFSIGVPDRVERKKIMKKYYLGK